MMQKMNLKKLYKFIGRLCRVESLAGITHLLRTTLAKNARESGTAPHTSKMLTFLPLKFPSLKFRPSMTAPTSAQVHSENTTERTSRRGASGCCHSSRTCSCTP